MKATEDPATWPKWGLFWSYPLTQGAEWLHRAWWDLKAHVFIVGPVAFCVLWRVPCKAQMNAAAPSLDVEVEQ